MSRTSNLNLTQADVDRMIRLRAKGVTIKEIAKEYNVSNYVVYRYTTIKVIGQLTPGQLQLIEQTKQAMLLLKQGYKLKQIAFIQHTCPDTVRKRIVAYKAKRGTFALIKK